MFCSSQRWPHVISWKDEYELSQQSHLDAEWACLQRHLPPASTRSRPPTHSLRAIFDAIFYVLRTGYPWRYLPSNFPPWQTVFSHFRRLRLKGIWTLLLRALHRAERERQGKNPHPSAAMMDAQSVKTVEESAGISGFDAHKRVKGRKRHILVDTLGIPLSISVTEADVHDTKGARCLLAGLKYFVPRLVKNLGRCGKRVGRSWLHGPRTQESGSWKWWNAHRAPVASASCPKGGELNEH